MKNRLEYGEGPKRTGKIIVKQLENNRSINQKPMGPYGMDDGWMVKVGSDRINITETNDGRSEIDLLEASNEVTNAVWEALDGGVTQDELESHSQNDSYERTRDKNDSGDTVRAKSDSVVEHYGDGSMRFKPKFTKDSAVYYEEGSQESRNTRKKCEDCVNFIEGGGCRIVQGKIHPGAFCEAYYADVAVFGEGDVNGGVSVPLVMYGEAFGWTNQELTEFIEKTRTRVNSKI